MELNLIHVSNLSTNGSWFERLLLALQERSIPQKLVTLDSREVVFSTHNLKSLNTYSPQSRARIFRYYEVAKFIQKSMSKDKVNFLFAQGHEESIICFIAAKLFGIEFGLIHHVQPSFFTELMKRKPIRALIHHRLYKYYIRGAELIQSLSTDVTDSITKLGVDKTKIVCLGHGTNFSEFERKISQSNISSRNSRNFPTLLMVGRLSWEKNYFLALESFKELCLEFEDAKLVIAGIGPMEIELKNYVKKNQMEHQVEFLGFVSNIPELMSNADALLHLAVSESYGQIYVEASLVDLPVITYQVGIVKELREIDIFKIAILNSSDPILIAKTISSICKNTFSNRKSIEFTLPFLAKYNEKIVFQKIGDYFKEFENRV